MKYNKKFIKRNPNKIGKRKHKLEKIIKEELDEQLLDKLGNVTKDTSTTKEESINEEK